MNKIYYLLFLTIGVFLLSGCVVQSLQPFYTDERIVQMPRINGRWFMTKKLGEDVRHESIKEWIIQDGQVITYDKELKNGELEAVFFKIDGHLFLDTYPESPEKENAWWGYHVYGMHTVCKVEMEGNSILRLIPLDYEWLKEQIVEEKIILAHENIVKDHFVLYTAASREWIAFLKSYKNNNQAFSLENEMIFERRN